MSDGAISTNGGHQTTPNVLRLSGDGVFATFQGEGVTAGRPSVFVRLQDCNLHCGKNDIGWRCDADYTWDKDMPEYYEGRRDVATDELVDEVTTAWGHAFPDIELTPNLVISGGEPLLQQRGILDLVQRVPGWDVEIETNGTVVPHADMRRVQFNCSPKLASSGNALRARRREKALRAIASMPNHWFKFVVASDEDIVEIREVVEMATDGDFSHVLLMAEGVETEILDQRQEMIEKHAKALGCLTTDRNHIYWFGNKRRT